MKEDRKPSLAYFMSWNMAGATIFENEIPDGLITEMYIVFLKKSVAGIL